MTMQELTKAVIGMAMEIHRTMGPGFNESIHEAQTVNYLTATNIDDGLILNFGAKSLQFRHKYRLYRRRAVQDAEPLDIH